MEDRFVISLDHPAIQAELRRRMIDEMKALLGEKKEENRSAYENNWTYVKELWEQNQEYLRPEGVYTFSEPPKLKCSRVEEDNVLAECIVVFSLKQYKGEAVLTQYLMHLLQISVMNAVRDYIQEILIPQLYRYTTKRTNGYVSEFYGPGLFEEPMDTMQEMLAVTKASSVHMVEGRPLLTPDMAFAGVLYVTKEPVILKNSACISCKAKVGCEYCMKRKRR